MLSGLIAMCVCFGSSIGNREPGDEIIGDAVLVTSWFNNGYVVARMTVFAALWMLC